MKLEKFLWCITLETIGLVFGFLGVFIGGLCLLSLICGFFFLLLLIYFPFHTPQVEDGLSGLLSIITVGFTFAIIILSANTYMYVVMIKGIRNKQHEKMEPWLVVQRIAIVINLLGMSFFLGGGFPFLFIALYIAGSAFHIYCYMAVHSLFENIKESSERGILTREITVGYSMPPTYSIAKEVEQPQIDFNSIKLV